MHRYVNYWDNNYWILYGPNLAEPRDPKIFKAPEKIIVRQTGDSIIAMIIGDNIICRNNLHICLPKCSDLDLLFLLGVLNAKVTDFVYAFINPEKGEALAEVKKAHVEMLPIPNATPIQQQEIAHIAKEVIDAKKDSKDTTYLEHQIDLLVCGLYGLSKEEIAIIDAQTK